MIKWLWTKRKATQDVLKIKRVKLDVKDEGNEEIHVNREEVNWPGSTLTALTSWRETLFPTNSWRLSRKEALKSLKSSTFFFISTTVPFTRCRSLSSPAKTFTMFWNIMRNRTAKVTQRNSNLGGRCFVNEQYMMFAFYRQSENKINPQCLVPEHVLSHKLTFWLANLLLSYGFTCNVSIFLNQLKLSVVYFFNNYKINLLCIIIY